MTDSTNEKPTPRHNRLNSQAEDFDFDLVEVRVDSDQENPAPIALDGFVTNDIIHTSKIPQQQSPAPNSFTPNKPSTLIAPAQAVKEIKTNFYVDYFDQHKQAKMPKSEPAPVANTDQPSPVENRSQDTMTTESHAEIPNESLHTEEDYEQTSDSQAPVVNGAGMAVAVLSQFKSKQESINKQQEKLIQEFSKKMKKVTAVTYTAVFFGVIALAAASTLGVMLVKTKSKVSDLAGTTTELKDNIRNIAKATSDDLEGTDPAIDQLNQKIDDVIEQLNEVAELQNKASTSDKIVTAKPATTVISAPIEKPATPTKPETTKPLVNTQPPATVAEKKPTPATVAEKKTTSETTVKATPANKAVKNAATAEQAAPVVKVTTAKPESNDKTANKASVSAPKKISDIPDKAIAVPANDINNVVNNARKQATANNTTAPQTSTSNSANTAPQTQTASGWTVNLGSSNKLEDAKNTAARFAQKGIPVSISSVTVKNETRYRLQVKGFKTKDEAAAYANKAKDTLKLNSVWINP